MKISKFFSNVSNYKYLAIIVAILLVLFLIINANFNENFLEGGPTRTWNNWFKDIGYRTGSVFAPQSLAKKRRIADRKANRAYERRNRTPAVAVPAGGVSVTLPAGAKA